MGNTVEIIGSGSITGQFEYTEPDGSTIIFYGWTFPVMVNGEVGVYTVWIDSDTDESAASQDAVDDLEADPDGLQGIAENDPGSDTGDPGDPGDDDDGDGAVAGNDGGDDASDSV